MHSVTLSIASLSSKFSSLLRDSLEHALNLKILNLPTSVFVCVFFVAMNQEVTGFHGQLPKDMAALK